jgi:hypothetical protein
LSAKDTWSVVLYCWICPSSTDAVWETICIPLISSRVSLASIALTGPFAGNIGAETPTVSLYYPEDERGTVFEAHDLGDLADQTFSIDLLHVDAPEPPRPLGVVVTIELDEGGESGDRYTLRGTVRLDFQADASD